MASTAELNAQYVYEEIDLDLIDEPDNPERETMDEVALAELAMNIAEVGLIKPLIVQPRGERYVTHAGHRRLLGCRMVKYDPVPCRVLVRGVYDPLTILVSENEHTEGINPVEQARFFARVLEQKCGNDIDALCAIVHKRREFVEDRLLILLGDESVMNALQERKISLAVARELNKVPDPNRRLVFLDVAITQGASARMVMEWRKGAEVLEPLVMPNDGAAAGANGDGAAAPVWKMECWFCEGDEDVHTMQQIFMHALCLKALTATLRRAVGGNAN